MAAAESEAITEVCITHLESHLEQAAVAAEAAVAAKSAKAARAAATSSEAADAGAEAIIGGCTEVPLLLDAGDAAVRLTDSAEVLARAMSGAK